MKIVGIILGVLVLGVAGAWFALIKAPSPEDVCAHLGTLIEKEGMPAAVAEGVVKECPDKMQKGSMEGAIPYAERMKCAMGAESLQALEACD